MNKVINILLSCFLLLDSIYGYFQKYNFGYGYVFQFLKLVLISLLFYKNFRKRLSSNIYLIIVLIYFIFGTGLVYLFDFKYSLKNYFEMINLSLKFIGGPLLYFFIKNSNYFTVKKIERILILNYIVCILNFGLYFFNLGYPQYAATNTGGRGYFFSGNEISITFLILSVSLLTISHINKIIIFINLVSCYILSTKTILLGFLIVFCSDFYKKIKKWNSYIVIIIFSSLFFYVNNQHEINLINHYKELASKTDFTSFLLSNRNRYVYELLKNYSNINVYEYLFGLRLNKTIEMDCFDIIINYGFIGIVLIYVYYAYLLYIVFKNKKNDFKIKSLDVLIILFVSNLTGHFTFSSMAQIFFALVNVYYYKKFQEGSKI